MKTILITGASGLIGAQLTGHLLKLGYGVISLTRKNLYSPGVNSFLWNIEKSYVEAGAVESADAIIHLAGENIGERRWTASRKKEILDSRVNGTKLLHEKIKSLPHNKVSVYISASATGYYGDTGERVVTENDSAGNDFLARTCVEWEEGAGKISETGIRVVQIRTGVVISKNGGAIPKLILPIKFFFGSALGSGKQYVPWIHEFDLCRLYAEAIENTNLSGAVNAVAPNPVTNFQLIKDLSRKLHRPVFLPPVPEFFLKILLGEMSMLLTTGCCAHPEKILKSGFHFKFENLRDALDKL